MKQFSCHIWIGLEAASVAEAEKLINELLFRGIEEDRGLLPGIRDFTIDDVQPEGD